MTNKQKISGLRSILSELFDSFRPDVIHPKKFSECILDYEHLERLKTEYEKIIEG